MVIRKIIAKDMQEAMEKIGREMGNEAVILNKRYFRKKGLFNSFRKEEIEVTVAHDPGMNKRRMTTMDSIQKPTIRPTTSSVISPQQGASQQGASQQGASQQFALQQQRRNEESQLDMSKIDDINARLNEFHETLQHFSSKLNPVGNTSKQGFSDKMEILMNRMIENGVKYDLAKQLIQDAETITANKEIGREQVLIELIVDILGEPLPIKLKKHRRTIVVLVGPTGAGKTTSLVKLAAYYTNEKKIKVGIINADTYRVAAQEQLNIYSDILNIPCHVVYGSNDYYAALKEQEDRDLIFIDTAGKSIFDPEYKTTIEAMLKVVNPDEIYLTLPISNSFEVCRNIIKCSSYMGNFKILLTKLDEVMQYGNVLNISNYSNKSLSYVTIGQQVPDDIEVIDVEKIARGIVKKVNNYD